MAIEWSEESAHKKEMKKWDRPKTEYVVKQDGTREYGMNRAGFEKYPQMLYKAQRNPVTDTYMVSLHRDVISADKTVVILSAEMFNNSCQMTVNDEREYQRAREDGWRDSQAEAWAYHTGEEQKKSVEAAVRAYEDSKMSEKAQAEVRKIEETTGAEHVLEVPEQPRRRGRKPGSKNKPKPEAAA